MSDSAARPALLEELRRLDAEAAPGPWSAVDYGNIGWALWADDRQPEDVAINLRGPDAALVAFLRNNAVALADALEAARTALVEAVAELHSGQHAWDVEDCQLGCREWLALDARLAVPEEPTDE